MAAGTHVQGAAQVLPVQVANVNPNADVETNVGDQYGAFRALNDPNPNDAAVTVQSLIPAVSTDQLPVDPSDKYSIFRSLEVSNPSVSNLPLGGYEASATSANMMVDSQAVGAPHVTAGSGSLAGVVGIHDVAVEQQPVGQDFGAFSDFQSAPVMSMSQPHPSMTTGGDFADFQSATFAVTPSTQPQSQGHLPSDIGISPTPLTAHAIIKDGPTQTLDTTHFGDFSAFQSTASVETPRVSFTNTNQAIVRTVELVHTTGDVQSSNETQPLSVHQKEPLVSQVDHSSDFSDFQMANTSQSMSISSNTNSHSGSLPATDSKRSPPSDLSGHNKTLLALAMDSQRDESPGPFVVVTGDLIVEEPAAKEQLHATDLLKGDIPLVEPVTELTSKPAMEDDSFGEFSGANVTSTEPELGFLSLEPAVSSMSAAAFSATSSTSSLSKMNFTSGNWSDLTSLADIGVSNKPVTSHSIGGSVSTTGDNETKLTDNLPSSHNMNVSRVQAVNRTMGDQTIAHSQPAVFGGRYDLTNSAETVSNVLICACCAAHVVCGFVGDQSA